MKKLFFKVYLLVIIALHILPINSVGELNNVRIIVFRADYFFHSIIFIPMPFLLWKYKKENDNWKIIRISLLTAISVEFVQYFIPYRAFNINDILANLIGISFGFVLILLLNFKVKEID